MSLESPNASGGWNCAREALAEMRACPRGLQTFVSSVFDRLDAWTDELLARELVDRQAQRQGEGDALQGQIDRLASVADELAEAIAAQKQLIGQRGSDP